MARLDPFGARASWRYLARKSFDDAVTVEFARAHQAAPGRRWQLGLHGPTARRWLALAEVLRRAGVVCRGPSRRYVAHALALEREFSCL